MRCKITGIKTKVRYKGRPISAKFLEIAIEMAKREEAADVTHALEILEKSWHKQMMEAKLTAQKSRSAINSAKMVKGENLSIDIGDGNGPQAINQEALKEVENEQN